MEIENLIPNSYVGVSFDGETDDGKKFTAIASQDNLGNWILTPNDIIWENEKGTDEQIQKIIDDILKELKG